MQALSRDQATILTRQEHKTRRDFRRLPGAPHRRGELVHGVVLHRRGDQWRPDGTGTHLVDADAEFHLLVGQGTGEGRDGAFAGGVVKEIGPANVGVDGAAIDDCVAGFHMREGVFGDEEHGVDVGVEGFDPLFPVGGS